MADAEIHYIIPNASEHQADVEQLLASIGAYQDGLHFSVPHTAEIAEVDEGAVELRFRRTLRYADQYSQMQHIAEQMRIGVESHLPEVDRDRLSRYFAGTAISGSELNVE